MQNKFKYRNVSGAIEAHLANFGRYQYGTSISAPLYLPARGEDGCLQNLEEEWMYAAKNHLTFNGFVILPNGGCSFETKARNVERLGGQVAVIIDYPEFDDPKFLEDEAAGRNDDNEESFNSNDAPGDEEEEEPVPEWVIFDGAYDGTGSSVHIPTILIPYSEGMELLNIIRAEEYDGHQVVLKADIELSQSHANDVIYELFYGSIMDLDADLILELYEYQHALGERASFVPRIKTFDCQFCPEDFKANQCIDDGKFCFFVPDDTELQQYPKIKPINMLHENLR